MPEKTDPMLNQHKALNRTFTRLREVQRDAHERIVTRPAAPMTMDPDKPFDEGKGQDKGDQRREFLRTLHEPPLRRAMMDQVAAEQPKMPKGLFPRKLIDFYLDGIKEFGLFG